MLLTWAHPSGPITLVQLSTSSVSICKTINIWPLFLQDYHVILLHKENTGVQVYDFDTTLNFPCSLEEYASNALRNEQNFETIFHRLAL
jgi:hypothetical protein